MRQLTEAVKFGFKVPETVITDSPSDLRAFWEQTDGRVITKPLSVGLIERAADDVPQLIYTSEVLQTHVDTSDQSLPGCSTLFQRKIEKKLDVRVTVVDSVVQATGLRDTLSPSSRLDIRRNNMNGVKHEAVALPSTMSLRICKLVQSYGLRFAAIDFVVDFADEWYFLEINPNGQWAWQDILGVTDIRSDLLCAFGIDQ